MSDLLRAAYCEPPIISDASAHRCGRATAKMSPTSHLASTASLAESLHFYWPTGHNEVPEPNISLRVGHALMEAGFFAYAEAQT